MDSLSEKICVVTGATSGIGKEIARGLARRGAQVAIICRNPDKGTATLAEAVPGGEMFVGDLSILADVRRVAAELHERYDKLDVLVNNAGIHDTQAFTSADGFDRMIATNHLGPFLLTNLLLDLLERADAARIVVVSSESHHYSDRFDPARLAEPAEYGMLGSTRVYGRSKLLNILFTQELAGRLAGTGITVNAMCPGLVSTTMTRQAPIPEPVLRAAVRTPILRTPEAGARMAIELAADPKFNGRSGRFFSSTPGAFLLPTARARRNRGLQQAVWRRSAELVGLP